MCIIGTLYPAALQHCNVMMSDGKRIVKDCKIHSFTLIKNTGIQ